MVVFSAVALARARLDILPKLRNASHVDALERSQIRLILEHITSEMCSQSDKTHKAMHADRAAARTLRSGDTVKRALNVAETNAREFITKAVDQVAGVAQDSDAFTLIVSSFTSILRHFEAQVAQAVRLATTGEGTPHFERTKREADRLFSELRNHMFRELEIHRFSFTKLSKSKVAEIRESVGQSPTATEHPKPSNVGGKPLASHWDAMWADIAVTLWQGDLNPKSQADIKAAMFAWFNSQGVDVGETAIRQRARQLWQKIEASG